MLDITNDITNTPDGLNNPKDINSPDIPNNPDDQEASLIGTDDVNLNGQSWGTRRRAMRRNKKETLEQSSRA